ncbi:hypothetical protein KO361_00435 [Candidatus Woesearchaeota archaeon]|nr:hypothetical protein [Candidatus Woesearchaeota archaeon]
MGKRNKKQETKKNNVLLYATAGILAVLIGTIVFIVAKPTSNVVAGEGELDEFAKCLTEQGAIFYGTEWCGFCQQQKTMFQESMQHINFIDCDQNRNTCQQEGITGYPTWKINGQLYPGMQQLTRLSDISGCELFA